MEALSVKFNTAVFDDNSLSIVDKMVYFVLCLHANNEARECSPKVATIAEEASCSPRAVYKSLNVLEERGIIQRIHRFSPNIQISSLYKIRDFSKEV